MKLTDPLKSAMSTAAWTFLSSVAVLSTGWLASLAKWASTSGHTPLPGLSVVGYAVLSALLGAAGGVVSFVVRFAQSKNVLPGQPPAFASTVPAPAAGDVPTVKVAFPPGTTITIPSAPVVATEWTVTIGTDGKPTFTPVTAPASS